MTSADIKNQKKKKNIPRNLLALSLLTSQLSVTDQGHTGGHDTLSAVASPHRVGRVSQWPPSSGGAAGVASGRQIRQLRGQLGVPGRAVHSFFTVPLHQSLIGFLEVVSNFAAEKPLQQQLSK